MDAVVKPANTDEAAAEAAVELGMLESPLVLDAAVEDEVEKIVKGLEEIARVLANPDSFIVCSSLFLPLTDFSTFYSLLIYIVYELNRLLVSP